MTDDEICVPCEDGTHEMCEDPEGTEMTYETGAHEVSECCCGTWGGGPDPDYERDVIRDQEMFG